MTESMRPFIVGFTKVRWSGGGEKLRKSEKDKQEDVCNKCADTHVGVRLCEQG